MHSSPKELAIAAMAKPQISGALLSGDLVDLSASGAVFPYESDAAIGAPTKSTGVASITGTATLGAARAHAPGRALAYLPRAKI